MTTTPPRSVLLEKCRCCQQSGHSTRACRLKTISWLVNNSSYLPTLLKLPTLSPNEWADLQRYPWQDNCGSALLSNIDMSSLGVQDGCSDDEDHSLELEEEGESSHNPNPNPLSPLTLTLTLTPDGDGRSKAHRPTGQAQGESKVEKAVRSKAWKAAASTRANEVEDGIAPLSAAAVLVPSSSPLQNDIITVKSFADTCRWVGYNVATTQSPKKPLRSR
jgi:hypothetical protein